MNNEAVVNMELVAAEWNQLAWGNFATNIEFLRRIGLTAPLKILEIGCGKGAMLNYLRQAGHAVAGIDFNHEAIKACHAAYPGIAASVGSGDALPFPTGSFDVVLSFDVFEHIRDSDRHLHEVRRVLKRHGSYLLQTPNKWTNIPFELLRGWKKFHTGPIASYRALVEDHCALHNYWQLRCRLAKHGFRATYIDLPVVNDYFRAKMRTYLGALAPPLLSAFNPDRWPLFLRTNFYVRAETD